MSTLAAVDNAKTVGKMYEAFGRGDIPYIVDRLTDDCKWIGAGEGFLPNGGTYIGKDVTRFFANLKQAMEVTSFNVTAIHNINENEVVAFGNIGGNSPTTGKPAASDWAMHWKFNDAGKVTFFQDYFDTAKAYAANQP